MFFQLLLHLAHHKTFKSAYKNYLMPLVKSREHSKRHISEVIVTEEDIQYKILI